MIHVTLSFFHYNICCNRLTDAFCQLERKCKYKVSCADGTCAPRGARGSTRSVVGLPILRGGLFSDCPARLQDVVVCSRGRPDMPTPEPHTASSDGERQVRALQPTVLACSDQVSLSTVLDELLLLRTIYCTSEMAVRGVFVRCTLAATRRSPSLLRVQPCLAIRSREWLPKIEYILALSCVYSGLAKLRIHIVSPTVALRMGIPCHRSRCPHSRTDCSSRTCRPRNRRRRNPAQLYN